MSRTTFESIVESPNLALRETPKKALLTHTPPQILRLAVSCCRQNYAPYFVDKAPLDGLYYAGIELESTLGDDDITSGKLNAFNPFLLDPPYSNEFCAYDPNGNPNLITSYISQFDYADPFYDNTNGFELDMVGNTMTIVPQVDHITDTLCYQLFPTANDTENFFSQFSSWPIAMGTGGAQIIPQFPIRSANINGWVLSGIVAYPRPLSYVPDYWCHPNGAGNLTQAVFAPFTEQILLASDWNGPNKQAILWRELAYTGTSIVLCAGSCGGAVSLHDFDSDGKLHPAAPGDVQLVTGAPLGYPSKIYNGPKTKAQVFWIFRHPKNVPTTANGGVAFYPHDNVYLGGKLLVLK